MVDGDTINFSTSSFQGGLLYFGQQVAPEANSLRLLGINAPEMSVEGGYQAKLDLEEAIDNAVEAGQLIYIIPDPVRDVDSYGRRLGWLYINGEPYVNPDTVTPRG